MEDRTAANAVNRNTVNEVSLSRNLSSADGPCKEAEGMRLYSRITKPTDVNSDSARLSHWQHCYGALWELKVSFEEKNNGRIRRVI